MKNINTSKGQMPNKASGLDSIIPIVFAANDEYAPYAAVTITSIIKNSSKNFFYDIYVFYTGLSEDILGKFAEMKGINFSVTTLDVNEFIDKEINFYENFHFSKEMYYRILIPTILKQYTKVIYLDCDMVVLGDISELFGIALDGCIIGGVNDTMHFKSKNYVRTIVKLDPEKYINSGMLLIDCTEFEKNKIKEKCFDILRTSNISFRYPDQDIINIACNGKIKFLDSCWNYIWHYNFPRYNQTSELLLSEKDEEEYKKKSENIKILHYTSNIKPWNNYNTVYTKFFFDYVQNTLSFKDLIYKRYNSINMKNYITFQFFDRIGEEIILTGAFYSIENYLYSNKVDVIINNKKSSLKLFFTRNIDIQKKCYAQSFFKLTLKLKDCKKGLKIGFSIKNSPNGRLKICTGKYFPINVSAQTKAYFNNTSMSIENKELIFQSVGRNEKCKYERSLRKRLKKDFGTAGKKSAWVRLVYFWTKPFFRKDIWLISDRITSAGDNGEAFFKYLKDNKPKNVKCYFVLSKKSLDYKRIKKLGKVVEPLSFKFDLLYLHAAMNISSQFDNETYFPFNELYTKDLSIKRKNVFLQHGITKDDISSAYSRHFQNISIFITSSQREYESIVNNFNYGLHPENIELTGFSRYDYLRNNPKKIIYVLPTWRKYLLSAVRENDAETLKQSEFYKFYTDLINNEKIISMLEKFGYIMRFVPHEHARAVFKDFIPKSESVEVLTQTVSYNEIFNSGSLLITDYSSAAFDFAYLKKPVIYCQFDVETIYKTHTYKPGYYDYEKDGFGKVVYDITELEKEIKKILSKGCKMDDKYLDRVNSFFAYNDNQNSQRILSALIKHNPKPLSLIERAKICYKEHGLRYTVKRVFAKISGRS